MWKFDPAASFGPEFNNMDIALTSTIDVTETDSRNDWSYLSEGGATIVFSYVGPSHPTYNGTVLRLRKSPRQNAIIASHPPPALHDADFQDEPDDPSIAFQTRVISKLVPNKYLPELRTVPVRSQWLKELEDISTVRRPVERTMKDGVDTTKRKAVLATDLVGGSGWAVEIKPKWGFLPSPEHLSPSTRMLKIRHCRFCMHTHVKCTKQGLADTSYCPLDLFSGDEARVRKALQSLWKTWAKNQGKGNNLRVFNEGIIVDPGNEQSLSSLGNKLLGSNQSVISSSELLPLFVDAVLPLILDNSLVSILAQLQRALDPLDIEGLSELWTRTHPGVPLGYGEPDPGLEEWDHFVRTFLAGGDKPLRYNILSYLLSATFKDCSVILHLHDIDNRTGKAENTITAIDLDPKSVSRLSKWEALDCDIVKCFAEVADRRMACVDTHQ